MPREPGFNTKKDKAPKGIFKHPSNTWAIRFQCGQGHIHERKIGTLKSEAIREHASMRQRVHDQPAWCPAQERRQVQLEVRAVPTFAEYAATWLTTTVMPHRKERTTDYYRRMIDLHLAPAFRGRLLTSLTPADVRQVIAEKLNAGLAKNTVKNVVATLRAVLNQAVDDRLIPTNPAVRLGKLFSLRHDPREHVVALEPDDVSKVLRAAVKWYSDHELGVRTLFYTGMREGELLGLQWPDIDWSRNLVDLRRTVAFRHGKLIVNTPKSGRLRVVDIPASLTARLRDRFQVKQAEAALAGHELGPWVFPAATDPTKPLNDAWLRDRVWKPLLQHAGVRHVRVHDARHTYASLMLRRGVPIAYVSKQLGHSSIAVTVDLYGHFQPGADRHHVEGLAQAFETALEGGDVKMHLDVTSSPPQWGR